MIDFTNRTVFHIVWDSKVPLVRDWCTWLERITPMICRVSGELP